jgi:hypothetical protein
MSGSANESRMVTLNMELNTVVIIEQALALASKQTREGDFKKVNVFFTGVIEKAFKEMKNSKKLEFTEAR